MMNSKSGNRKACSNYNPSNLVSRVKLKIKHSQIENKQKPNKPMNPKTNKVICLLKDRRTGRSQHKEEHHNFDKDNRDESEHLERLYFGKKYHISHEPLEIEDDFIERRRYSSLCRESENKCYLVKSRNNNDIICVQNSNDRILNKSKSKQKLMNNFRSSLITPPKNNKTNPKSSNMKIPLPPKRTKNLSNKTNERKQTKITNRYSQDKNGLKLCESYKSLSQCNKSDYKVNKCVSKTTQNSHSTTPNLNSQSNAKSSQHFMKIVDKFQNVFKKENQLTDNTDSLMKMSRSKPNLICNDDNFIWKKFEERIHNCNNFMSICSNDNNFKTNKPIRPIYGQNTKMDISDNKDSSIEEKLPQKYLVPNIVDSKESTIKSSSKMIDDSTEMKLRSTYKISGSSLAGSMENSKTLKEINQYMQSKENISRRNSEFVVSKEIENNSDIIDLKLPSKQENVCSAKLNNIDTKFQQNPPIKNEFAIKMKRFQKLEEEIAIYQQQIDKLARLREDSKKRVEYHNKKSDDGENDSNIVLCNVQRKLQSDRKENLCPNKYEVDAKLNHYKRFI